MAIVVVCPSCGHRAGAKDEWVGRQVKCPGCGNKVVVQSPEAPSATDVPQRPATHRPAAQRQPPAAQARPTPGQTSRTAGPRAAAPASRGPLSSGQRPRQPPPALGGDLSDLFGEANLSAGDPLGAAMAATSLGAPPTSIKRKKPGSAKTLWIVLGIVSGVVVLGCMGLFIVGAVFGVRAARERALEINRDASSTANLPVWSPDPSLASQLSETVSFDQYSIRLPNGYAALQLPLSKQAPSGIRLQHWVWADAPAPDGTRHVITAVLADSSSGHSNNLDAEVKAYLQSTRAEIGGATFIPGATTKGQLLAQRFARTTYSVATPQVTLHSVTYLGFDGPSRVISVICGCKEAVGSEVYQLLETSLLTLRRK